MNLGLDFDPIQKFYEPKLSVLGGMLALFMGFNAGLSVMYYRQENHGGLHLRPEIGLGLPRSHLKYEGSFRILGDDITVVKRDTLWNIISHWKSEKLRIKKPFSSKVEGFYI